MNSEECDSMVVREEMNGQRFHVTASPIASLSIDLRNIIDYEFTLSVHLPEWMPNSRPKKDVGNTLVLYTFFKKIKGALSFMYDPTTYWTLHLFFGFV